VTKLAQLLLVLTSLAPVAFVESAVAVGRRQCRVACILIVFAAFLVLLCVVLLWGLARRAAPVPKEIKEPLPKETESLAFLVAYALPLVSAKADAGSMWGVGAFGIVMAIVVWQQQLFHVNPLLAILGFHFLTARTNDGAQVTIVSRTRLIPSGVIQVVRLSESLWVHSKVGGNSGSSTGDP
jgi:hypothetical protein